MPVDFSLSAQEEGIRKAAAAFASGPLTEAKKTYMQHQEHSSRFQSTRPFYSQAVAGGLIRGQIPPHLGGAGGTLVETAILVEEMYRVEPSTSLTIFSTGLGLLPLVITGKPEHNEFLAPFLSGQGEPLASLVFSEPGGVANFLEKGGSGLGTTATLEGDEWVLNGEKVCRLTVTTHLPFTAVNVLSSPIKPTSHTDMGHELRRLGLHRRRPPMRHLPHHRSLHRHPCRRNHDPARHRRGYPAQRSWRLQSPPTRLHCRSHSLLRPACQIHKSEGAEEKCVVSAR